MLGLVSWLGLGLVLVLRVTVAITIRVRLSVGLGSVIGRASRVAFGLGLG